VTQLRKKMLEELPLSICRFWILFGIEPGARTSIQAHVPSSFSCRMREPHSSFLLITMLLPPFRSLMTVTFSTPTRFIDNRIGSERCRKRSLRDWTHALVQSSVTGE
jgi:hypothetical protein